MSHVPWSASLSLRRRLDGPSISPQQRSLACAQQEEIATDSHSYLYHASCDKCREERHPFGLIITIENVATVLVARGRIAAAALRKTLSLSTAVEHVLSLASNAEYVEYADWLHV